MKKILSIVLAAVLTLTSLPAGTAYAFEGGDVSYSDAEETVVAEETVITEETTDESSYDSVPSGDSAGNEEADVTDNDETTDTEITYDDATPDENGFTWNGYTITKYTGTAKEVVIPAKCMEIGNDAFSGNTTITKVTFEENSKCTTIGSQAFYNCKSLASITFPDKLTTIGSNAFYQDALTSVIIPSKVKTIGAVAFSKNASLSSVTILSNNIAKIDYPYQSFYGCSISTITWGENVNKIPGRLFSEAGFASDMKIVIPARFTEIGEGAFYKTSITGLSFEEGSKLTDIGAEAFNQCAGIQSLVLPKSVKTIGGCAFKQNNLSEIVIPENVTTIENSAFKQNKNLKKVTIESNGIVATYDIFAECAISEVKFSEDMTAIPKYLFNRAGFAAGCVITIPQKVQTIGDYSFTNTIISGIVFAPGSVLTSIGENAFANCIYIDEIAFPESLTTIGRYAFNSCSLEELTIPSKVTSIGQQAFENNKGLSKVVINSNAEGAWSIFGNCCIEELVFGDNVTSIGKYLFYYQGSDPDTKSGFDSNCIVTIPKGVKTIDEGAFSRSGFAELRFEEGSQLTAIGDKAFYQCVNLEKVTLPESLETIGVYAFSECNLEEITIPKNVKKIGMWAFATNKYLSKVVVLSNVLDIPMDGSGFGGTFTGCAIEELILSGSMKTIAPRIFSQTGFAANTSVVLPSGITKIGYESFASCTKMTDIYMGSKVSEIGERAFSGCESTLTIHAPKGSYAINWAKKHGFKYEEITVYKITYELNGGTNSAENPGEYMSGKEVKFATPSKTGCTFLGWFTNKDFAEGTQISHIIGNEGKDITIYAKWQVNNYTIHFETNEPAVGSCTGTVADIAAEYGKEYTNPSGANKFTFERYTQTGWNTKADGSGTSYALDAKFKNLTGENGATVTLYAQWEGANIVVSFDTNKGKTSTGRVTFSGKDYTTAYGKAMTIPATKPSSSGHEFFGWSFEQDSAVPDITLEMLGNQLDDSVRRAIESHALGGSDKVTLYAVWRSAVSEVKLTTYAETMYPGGTMEIYAIVSPDDVVTKEVTWKSSDERIATVTNESIGRTIVTAHKSGTVKITATSKATGHISATATITVATKITSLEVKVKGKTDTEALLQTGKTVQLEVVFNGGIEKPSNTNVIYDSEDSTVATVSATGLVTAKSGGIVWISARSAADPHVSTRFSVEVYDPVKSIELNTKKLKLCDGDSYQFFETVKPNTASEVGVEWSVSDISVADVTKDGLVTAHLPSGKTNAKVTVTATAKDGSGKKASCVITVGPKLETISLKAPKNYKVFINGAPAIAAGKSIKLSASFTPGNAVNKDVVWSSSNPSLATVDTKGNVKGISAGFAEITATHPYNSSVNTKQLVYVYVPVTKISLNASKLDMRAGNKFSLKATTNDGITLTDADGNVNPAQITWTSSDENVATVNESGVVTALPLGGKTAASATITASVTTDGNVTKTA
ncbi:MAG: leucine-rich repeat protein, partial [Lachnospiraceae bacterium]|nr:leucine-rich repeat protein [Lachnospiraceae bacterium]